MEGTLFWCLELEKSERSTQEAERRIKLKAGEPQRGQLWQHYRVERENRIRSGVRLSPGI
jgi:hypothetical protein